MARTCSLSFGQYNGQATSLCQEDIRTMCSLLVALGCLIVYYYMYGMLCGI